MQRATLPLPASINLTLFAWFAAASLATLLGVVRLAGPPIAGLTIASGVVLGLWAHRSVPAARAWAEAAPLRGLVLYQTLRAPIGAAFLWLAAQGRFPQLFADVAGYGDIVAGLGALVAAACLPATTPARRRLVLLWNAFGLLDILVVVGTAQTLILGLGRRELFDSFVRAPMMAVVPLFVVPTVILAHLLIFARLRRAPA